MTQAREQYLRVALANAADRFAELAETFEEKKDLSMSMLLRQYERDARKAITGSQA